MSATVWREGSRIRATNGIGYSDRVTDEQIEGHIANHDLDDVEWHAFAIAVLAIRAYERAAAEGGQG